MFFLHHEIVDKEILAFEKAESKEYYAEQSSGNFIACKHKPIPFVIVFSSV